MPLLRSFGFGWRGGCKDVAPTALDGMFDFSDMVANVEN